MIAHLLKLMWNKKKHHLLLVVEILVSFLVIFALSTLMVYYYRNYTKPMGFNEKNVWQVNYENAVRPHAGDSVKQFYGLLLQQLKSLPEVEDVSLISENSPFSSNTNQGSVTYKGRQTNSVNNYRVDDNYAGLGGLEILEGRWYSRDDDAARYEPIVLSSGLREAVFGNRPAVGQLLDIGETKRMVIGVVQEPKFSGDFVDPGIGAFFRVDTTDMRWNRTMLIRVKPGFDRNAQFEGRLYKMLAASLGGANVEIEHLDDKRRVMNRRSITLVVILLVVSTFLIVNVALGMFGVLWYNINKRRGEIGIRRALGATGTRISQQLVGESLVIATFALVIGCFFAVQFPLLNVFNVASGTYYAGILLSVLFIYLLVLVCSLYPGKQAAAIFPAAALHED